jgi:Creatinine amidohydrolase
MHYEWRKLRADQLREQARKEAIVILPVATIEQHGPHLPVEGDSMLGEAVAARTAEKVQAKGQEVLVLPALWTGLRRHNHSGQRDLHRRRRRRGEIRTTPRVQTHRAAERAWRQRQCPPPPRRRPDAEAGRADRAVQLPVRRHRRDRQDPGDGRRIAARLRSRDRDDDGRPETAPSSAAWSWTRGPNEIDRRAETGFIVGAQPRTAFAPLC